MIVDMHCHLDLYPDPLVIARQCKSHGIYALSVTTTPKAWHGTSRLVYDNPRIRTALGFHPQLAHERYKEQELFDTLLPDAKYVGEIGLDGGKGFKEHWDVQLKIFRHILRSLDAAGGRLMSVHSRACVGAVLSELDKYPAAGPPILHWFTGSKTELKRAIDQGCWFSVGPAMFASIRCQELVALMPRDKILPESDGPFARLNRETLMPWETVHILPQIAKLWRESVHDVGTRLFQNFRDLVKTLYTW